jgi:hypothetical protein
VLATFLGLPVGLIVLISLLVPVAIAVPITMKVSNAHVTSGEGFGYEGLISLFGFVGTAFALLLAFIIVNVQREQVSAQSNLFHETSTLESVLEETKEFDPGLVPEVKSMILDYLTVMRANEIAQTPAIGGDPQAEAAFTKILARFDKLAKGSPGDAANAVLAEANKLVEIRNLRVDAPAGSLDQTVTVIGVTLALITAAVMALLPAPRRWVKWVQSLGVAVSVGLVLSLVFYLASDGYTKKSEDLQIASVEQIS